MKIPDNLKPATNYDLCDEKGKVAPGIKFFVHGYHPEVYGDKPEVLEEHVTTEDTDLEKWKEWMDDRRLFVEVQTFKPQASLTLDYI